MVTIEIPPFRPLVGNFVMHIYVISCEALCMNGHLLKEKKREKEDKILIDEKYLYFHQIPSSEIHLTNNFSGLKKWPILLRNAI